MARTTGTNGRKRRPKKDRVLQARIPEQLDEELRDRAEELGLSVSTIVRNVLLHTFNLVEGVVADSAQIARAFKGRDAPTPSAGAPDVPSANAETGVIGWQEAVLNRNGLCERCNVILPRGERAAVGMPAQTRPVFLCLDCLNTLSSLLDSTQTPSPSQPPENTRPATTKKPGKKPTN